MPQPFPSTSKSMATEQLELERFFTTPTRARGRATQFPGVNHPFWVLKKKCKSTHKYLAPFCVSLRRVGGISMCSGVILEGNITCVRSVVKNPIEKKETYNEYVLKQKN